MPPFPATAIRPLLLAGLLAAGAAAPAHGADLALEIEIPRMDVAEYHRPYVAVWIEDGERQLVRHLAVWYELSNREGDTWLKDLRQWWRRGGRGLEVPADGLTGATRAPGTHRLRFAGSGEALAGLAPGDYRLLVEASREVGGREVLEFPLAWPPAAPARVRRQGERELGRLELQLTP